MKSIIESIIGRRGVDHTLYLIDPDVRDFEFYQDLEKTHKLKYPHLRGGDGRIFYLLTKDEVKKFWPEYYPSEAWIFEITDKFMNYEKIAKDISKRELSLSGTPYMKAIDKYNIKDI